jgi:hypothetical protein
MTDEEAIREYAALHRQYQDLWDAACRAAIDAGAREPQGLAERWARGRIRGQGGLWSQTPLVQGRVERAAPEEAWTGAEAYVAGGRGNAYTACLRRMFGPYRPGN